MANYVIIVAAGIGRRMKNALPKQFHTLGSLPLLMRTMHAFYASDIQAEVVLVLPKDWFSYWTDLCYKFDFHVPHAMVEGGETRFQSVKNGLEYIASLEEYKEIAPSNHTIAVHDGARPLITSQLIETLFKAVSMHAAVIPGIPSTDSIRWVEEQSSKPLNRDQVYVIQTPQVFNASMLMDAYQKPASNTYTDDASVVEANGGPVVVIPGDKRNLKITTEEDLLFAEAILQQALK